VFAGPFASRSFTRQYALPGQIRGLEWLSTDHSLVAVSDGASRRFSPEGTVLAEGRVFERQESAALACDRRDRRLAIGGSEGSIALIDVRDGRQTHLSPPASTFALEPQRFGRVRALAFSPRPDNAIYELVAALAKIGTMR
jgi:hypothetical protein